LLDQVGVSLDLRGDGHVHESVANADGHSTDEGGIDGGGQFDHFAALQKVRQSAVQILQLSSAQLFGGGDDDLDFASLGSHDLVVGGDDTVGLAKGAIFGHDDEKILAEIRNLSFSQNRLDQIRLLFALNAGIDEEGVESCVGFDELSDGSQVGFDRLQCRGFRRRAVQSVRDDPLDRTPEWGP